MPKKPALTYTVDVDWAGGSAETFNTLGEAQAHVLNLLQNGVSLDGINMMDSEERPLYLTAVKFELAK